MTADDMWGRVDWMVPADMEILRLLSEPQPLELRPGDIARNTGYGATHIRRRCKILVEHDLLYVDENGHPYYGSTALGTRVLNRDVSPDELIMEDGEE